MTEPPMQQVAMPPRWLMFAGSLTILFHLGVVGLYTLAVQSGPWVTPLVPMGQSTAEPPQFAELASRTFGNSYLFPLRMNYHYHFGTNYPSPVDVALEVKLRDKNGQVVKTLKFPDADANFLARHRQKLLAYSLTMDEPVAAPGPEVVAAPGQELSRVPIWDRVDATKPNPLKLAKVPAHQVPRNFPVYRPSGWSLLLAESYARYLCREHGAASAEIVRHIKYPINPVVLVAERVDQLPETLVGLQVDASFGELPQ